MKYKALEFKTQDQNILRHLISRGPLTPLDALKVYGCFRLAAVINRLRKRMRLQTDPTVIYGLGKNFDGDIRFRDLRADTPYNTYTRRGLPPTPIAMPGQEALEAVMHPDTTPYLYFVARGDASGSHVFSETLEQHEQAVNQYQRRRRKK